MNDDAYVTNDAWLSAGGRPDVIDDVADQFERPTSDGATTFWNDIAIRRAARESSLAPRHLERRAG